MIAARHAARDLHVEQAVSHPVAPDDFADHVDERGPCHRPVDAQFAERAAEAIEMTGEIDDIAVTDLADLVDPVGELITAVLDMDAGVRVRHVGAVDIGNSGHRLDLRNTGC